MRAILPLLLFSLIVSQACSAQSTVTSQVCFQKECVNVEIVQKPDELERGLMFREELAKKSGMLFIFSTSRPQGFWMKNTLIPLDIIWMDYSRRVVHIEHNVPPCKVDPCFSYTPTESSLYVLEVNAGEVEQMKIHVGQIAEFKFKHNN